MARVRQRGKNHMTPQTHDRATITVTIGGDFCPVGRPQLGLLNGSYTADTIVGPVKPFFAESDIGIVNLECPLSERSEPTPKSGPHFRADPRMIRLLTHLGVTGVTLANNHIRDFGDAGVAATLSLCAANGIRTVGAGATLDEARQPVFVKTKGRVVAFINAAEKEFNDAAPHRPGANPLDLMDLLRDVRQARLKADHLILIIHGGLELTHCPSPESVKILRFLAEQNVTAIIRHHAHYVQGYEVWQGVPIFYGLGNMLFDVDPPMAPDWYEGLLVRLHIAPGNSCRAECIPIRQCDPMPCVAPLEGEAKAQAHRNLAANSALLTDPDALALAWEEAIRPMRETYYGKLLLPARVVRSLAWRLGLAKYIRPSQRSALLWRNLLRCDTHREALVDLLSRDYPD